MSSRSRTYRPIVPPSRCPNSRPANDRPWRCHVSARAMIGITHRFADSSVVDVRRIRQLVPGHVVWSIRIERRDERLGRNKTFVRHGLQRRCVHGILVSVRIHRGADCPEICSRHGVLGESSRCTERHHVQDRAARQQHNADYQHQPRAASGGVFRRLRTLFPCSHQRSEGHDRRCESQGPWRMPRCSSTETRSTGSRQPEKPKR